MVKKRRRRPPPKPTPLVGALAFGNDPDGSPRGSEAFGGADEQLRRRGELSPAKKVTLVSHGSHRGDQRHAVQIEYLQMAPFCRSLRTWRDRGGRSAPRLVLNTHELGSVPRERKAARAANVALLERRRADGNGGHPAGWAAFVAAGAWQ